MLLTLAIKNIAIIDQLEIDFERGLNVMTGETGAGKTIIAQSLALVLGARAQPDMIRTGEDEAEVAATFLLDDSFPGGQMLRGMMEQSGVEVDSGELVIRRVVTSGGRSKATINGVPVTLGMLKDIAVHLVDVSSQHENQLLVDPENHVTLIDEFGVDESVRENYARAYSNYTSIGGELQRLREDEASAKEKLEFLKFQLHELKAASPHPGEIEHLEEKRSRLRNAVVLESSSREASEILYESPGSVAEILNGVSHRLSHASQFDPKFTHWYEALERARVEVEEVARDAKEYSQHLGEEPERIEEIEDRLHLLRGLVRKHGGTLEEAIGKIETLSREIDRVENFDEVLETLERELEEAKQNLVSSAKKLTGERSAAADRLSRKVQKELVSLAMGKVRFVTEFNKLPFDGWDAKGPERIEFFISPNVGEEVRPLARTASGGELSRIMLAIKRVLADRASLAATYIFDEVDSGIGGGTAEVVGRKLMEVASARQVICITHLPQVACFGHSHYRIGKDEEKGRTVTSVSKLDRADRVDEIARMLGGMSVTDLTKKHAEELLNGTTGKNRK